MRYSINKNPYDAKPVKGTKSLKLMRFLASKDMINF